MDLEVLLRAARDGEAGAWDPLIRQLYRVLRPYFCRDFDEYDSLELTQHTVEAVCRRLPGFVPRESLTQWVFGIALSQALKEFNARKRKTVTRELADSVLAATGARSTSRIYANQLLAIVLEEVEKLPPHYRWAIEKDLEAGDIDLRSERDGIPVATARSRRAHLKLREQLAERLSSPLRSSADSDLQRN